MKKKRKIASRVKMMNGRRKKRTSLPASESTKDCGGGGLGLLPISYTLQLIELFSWTYIFAIVSSVVVNKTKSRDILESAILVMMTSVFTEGSSPVRNQRSSYCIGQGD